MYFFKYVISNQKFFRGKNYDKRIYMKLVRFPGKYYTRRNVCMGNKENRLGVPVKAMHEKMPVQKPVKMK